MEKSSLSQPRSLPWDAGTDEVVNVQIDDAVNISSVDVTVFVFEKIVNFRCRVIKLQVVYIQMACI